MQKVNTKSEYLLTTALLQSDELAQFGDSISDSESLSKSALERSKMDAERLLFRFLFLVPFSISTSLLLFGERFEQSSKLSIVDLVAVWANEADHVGSDSVGHANIKLESGSIVVTNDVVHWLFDTSSTFVLNSWLLDESVRYCWLVRWFNLRSSLKASFTSDQVDKEKEKNKKETKLKQTSRRSAKQKNKN